MLVWFLLVFVCLFSVGLSVCYAYVKLTIVIGIIRVQIYQFVCLDVCMYVCMSVCMSVCLPVI